MHSQAKQMSGLFVIALICLLSFTAQLSTLHAAEEADRTSRSSDTGTRDGGTGGSTKESDNATLQMDDYGDVTTAEGAVDNGRATPSGEYGDVSPKEFEGTEITGEGAGEAVTIADPLEKINRAFFAFNDKLYFWVIKPVSKAYRRIVPEEFRIIFGNFYRNLGAPIRVANNMLQLKARQTGTEIFRFLANSTIGVGGLRDAARDVFGIEPAPEDLGQTFGFYGFGTGFYILLPVLGPSSLRDGLGLAGDLYLSPVTYLDPTLLRYGLRSHDRINDVSFRIGDYEAFKKAALDPYVAMREAYASNRAAEIRK